MCREFPRRLQALEDAEGDRVDHRPPEDVDEHDGEARGPVDPHDLRLHFSRGKVEDRLLLDRARGPVGALQRDRARVGWRVERVQIGRGAVMKVRVPLSSSVPPVDTSIEWEDAALACNQ